MGNRNAPPSVTMGPKPMTFVAEMFETMSTAQSTARKTAEQRPREDAKAASLVAVGEGGESLLRLGCPDSLSEGPDRLSGLFCDNGDFLPVRDLEQLLVGQRHHRVRGAGRGPQNGMAPQRDIDVGGD